MQVLQHLFIRDRMIIENTLDERLMKFIRSALPEQQSNDNDVVDLIKLVGEKRIKSSQPEIETKKFLAEVLKDEKIIQTLLDYFNEEGKRFIEQQTNKNSSSKEVKQKIELSGKAIVHKSQSDIPQIYKEMSMLKSRNQDIHRQKIKKLEPSEKRQNYGQRLKGRNNEQRVSDKAQQKSQNIIKEGIKKQKMQLNENSQKIAQSQGKAKCKYFPFCTKENCVYFHPTQKCPYFPKCQHKSDCKFVHEACKFGEACTRPDCFYDHPFNSRKSNNNPLLNMMKMMMAGSNPTFKKSKKQIKSEAPAQENDQVKN